MSDLTGRGRFASLLIAVLLSACGDSSSPPPPPAPPPAVVANSAIALGPSAAWAITQGSPGVRWQSLSNGAFDFPQCASASICWVSYIEIPLSANIAALNSITLNYTITGDNPIFANDSPNNNCGGPVQLSLHFNSDSNLNNPMGRWFSTGRQALELGSHTFTVSLHDPAQWTAVYPNPPVAAFSQAISHVISVGFVLGGGCFSGHGVAVTSGSARFTLDSYVIK